MTPETPQHRQAAEAQQALAADPRASVLVAANAGSGKTHVLINRVIRILLDGAAPEQILCVTYTKAAASEMLNRLYDRLGQFSILPDNELRLELRKLNPDMPQGPEYLTKARSLFARALETPGGLKIQTIHGFCASLLRQFPIEAGISPGFEVIDDAQSAKLQKELVAAIANQTLAEPEGGMAAAYALLGQSGSSVVPKVFETARNNAHALTNTMAGPDGLQEAIRASAQHLGVGVEDTEQSLCKAGMAGFSTGEMDQIIEALAKGAKTNQAQADQLRGALLLDDPAAGFHALVAVFLKKDFARRDKLFSKAAAEYLPNWESQIEPVIGQIEEILDQVWAVESFAMTRAALVLCHQFVQAYARAKREAGLVDYDDQIEFTHRLLHSKISTEWVLYKLDGNLRHVLVDEAQDNSAAQWQVIGALTDEFFSGKGALEEIRTLFAVGDPKQSIYKFQGAEPALFQEQKEKLQARGEVPGMRVHIPKLHLSWRSTPEVLKFVDACFAPLAQLETKYAGDVSNFETVATELVSTEFDPGFSDYMEHEAERIEAVGSVTVLPVIPYKKPEPDTDPSRPVDMVSTQAPVSLLAQQVAEQIGQMLARGDQIPDSSGQSSAVQPGDILILVRSRNALFREIIRHLKLQKILIAGADRMTLQSETAVYDLMAIAKFSLQPSDDLSLAEVLKGPLTHPEQTAQPLIDDQVLYDLSQSRAKGQSLFGALMASSAPVFEEIQKWLLDLISRATHESPYRFFSGLMYRRSGTGETMIRRLYARLGQEAADPVQELLNKALGFNQKGDGSLLSFVIEMAGREDIIKREMEEAGNAVRVMTVHGAKGLEAPVVILPDTTGGSGGQSQAGLVQDQNCWIWSGSGKQVCRAVAQYQASQQKLDEQESRRLLYVALTRARDHLIIGGHGRGNGKNLQDGVALDSWYIRCQTASQHLEKFGQAEVLQTEDGQIGYRLGDLPPASNDVSCADAIQIPKLPLWALEPFEMEVQTSDTKTPSRLRAETGHEPEIWPAVTSPIGPDAANRFRRGNLIHSLLQILPDIDPDQHEDTAKRFLDDYPQVTAEQSAEIIAVTMGVLNHAVFVDLFGSDSRAELPITGTVSVAGSRHLVQGKIDRLVVRKDEILVLDFKTNRPPPQTIDAVSQTYIDQMATYRALLAQVWPNRKVRCALLWTDGPDLMEIPSEMMDHITV
ncbi:MAG: double-strand break repair helicase AddA [Robiginitomaculum sp.]|nr:MAG: double-strand break repair helicase AddA [Robiginitomaculum sp.]